jgi:hypothetical protein
VAGVDIHGYTEDQMRDYARAAIASHIARQPTGDLTEKVRAAMIRAYDLGQKYWMQADSEYASEHKKSDVTAGRFIELNDELCAAIAAHLARQAQAEPEGWVLAPKPRGRQSLAYLIQQASLACIENRVMEPDDRHEFAQYADLIRNSSESPSGAQNAEAIRNQWISVDERLPEVGVLVLVYSPPTKYDHPGDMNIGFDCIDPNDDDHKSWLNHNEHYEHFCCVAKPEGSVGPSADAPYTHWMPLPEAPSLQTGSANTQEGSDE